MDCTRWFPRALALLLFTPACGQSSATSADQDTGEESETQTGDGDGDPTTGDGDPTTGDGDGDPGGDGDGDPEPPTDYAIGFDVTDITPDEFDLADEFYLGGYGVYTERGPAQGVHDPVFVRSMAIGYDFADGGIFAVVDAVGFGNLWTRQIRAEVAEATGLDPYQVVVSATHTHSGPDFQGLWGGVPDVYRERAIGLIVDSMVAAWNAREPATLSVGAAEAGNRNRRGWGFTDPALVALQAHALDDGALLGTTVIFAAHPVVLDDDNLLVSRDFCGTTVDNLEAATGAPALYINGIQGDVSPVVPDGMYADDFERAAAFGEHVAGQALAAIANTEPVDYDMYHDVELLSLDVTNELFLLAAQAGILDYEFDTVGQTVDTQATYFRLGGQVQIVVFPGESLTRNGLPIKDVMTAPYPIVLGLSGDSLGYFVPSDEWMTGLNGDYEESVSVGEAAGDVTRDLMISIIGADPG